MFMRKRLFLLILVVVTLFLGACSFGSTPAKPPGDASTEDKSITEQAGVLLTGNGVVLSIIEEEPVSETTSFVIEQLPLVVPSSGRVYPFGSGYLLRDSEEIKLFDEEFNVTTSQGYTKIGAIKTAYPFIYLAADGSFMVLDEKLKRLSKINFKFPDFYPGMKNAHHIIIHDEIAYLLDNIIEPLFIFKVSVDNPRKIKLLFEYEYYDINAKLISQWLEHENEAWAILQSAFYRTDFGMEASQGITLFMPGHEDGAYHYTYKEKHIYDDDLIVKEGSLVHADSATSPNWFVTEHSDTYYLSTTAWDQDRLIFEDKLVLDFINPDHRIRLALDGNHLFLANGKMLAIIDLTKGPGLVGFENLSGFGIDQVNSLEPLHP